MIDTKPLAGTAAQRMDALRELIRLHHRRLYRTARAILRDDAEAEDAVQEACLQAYRALGTFRGESQLSTWHHGQAPAARLGAHAHDRHAGHSVAMFRNKFWASLALTVPILVWGHMRPRLFGYTPPHLPGASWIVPVFGTEAL